MNIILFSGIASVHAQSPSALISAELIAVDSGTHAANIYFYSNSAALKVAVTNASNFVRRNNRGEAVIRVCVSRGGRAFCGPVITWLNCAATSSSPAAEACGRGCEAWDEYTYNRNCADGGAAWAEVPCGSEPGAVCSTSAQCGGNCGELEFDHSTAGTLELYPVFREDDVMMLPGPSTAPACPTISIHAVSNGTALHSLYFHGDDSGSMAALLNGSTSTYITHVDRRQVVINACLYRSGMLMGCQGFTIWSKGACGSGNILSVPGTKVCGIGARVSSRNLTSGLEYEEDSGWHFPIFQPGDTLVSTEGCETSPAPESPQPDPHLECISQMLTLPNTTLNATHHQLGWTIPECANTWDFGIRVSTVPPNVLDGTCTQGITGGGSCRSVVDSSIKVCEGSWQNNDLSAIGDGTANALCGRGYHICGNGPDGAEEIRQNIDGTQCRAMEGTYVSALPHCVSSGYTPQYDGSRGSIGCTISGDTQSFKNFTCRSSGGCAQPLCCGSGCVYGDCRGAVWGGDMTYTTTGGTVLSSRIGCGNFPSSRANPLLFMIRTTHYPICPT